MESNKRNRFILPPCHDEFRYEDGELINQDSDNRLQGASAKFTREKGDGLPIGDSLKSSEQMRGLGKYTQTSWDTVLRELYSDQKTDPPTKPSAAQRAGEAFVSRYDNQAKPQFYLLTTSHDAILSHIQPDGVFWDNMRMFSDINPPKVGDMCYTNGFVWTNPSATWSWKNKSNKRMTRVRIDVSAGTQVVIDRAPVFGGVGCQFDERASLFPDVLLAPAEFTVTNVVRYRSTEEKYSKSDELPENFIYVSPVMRGKPKNDLEYAKLRVFDVLEFMDVRVTMVRQIKLPPVGSVKFT